MKMKSILRIIASLTLIIIITTSVVACCKTFGITINVAVAKQLGLTADDGGKIATKEAKLSINNDNTITWIIPTLTIPIAASKLLADDSKIESKAANQACYNFITSTLQIKPIDGTSFIDGIFDNKQLSEIKGVVSDIKPILTKTVTNEDYAIIGGTFKFQFKRIKDTTTVFGDNYTVNLKTDIIKGVITSNLAAIVSNISINDTDIVTNSNILFEKDKPIQKDSIKTTVVTIAKTTILAKLNILTGLKITAQVTEYHAVNNKSWEKGDTLTISYQTATVNFDKNNVKTKFTIPG